MTPVLKNLFHFGALDDRLRPGLQDSSRVSADAITPQRHQDPSSPFIALTGPPMRDAPNHALAHQRVALALLGGALSLPLAAAHAQYSPNCLRNGKPDHCAITVVAAGNDRQPVVERITFADHRVYEARRDGASCKVAGLVTTCTAQITAPASSGRPMAARYRGTAYEGGYKHEYLSPRVQITYFFLD